jgi:hypothetical protein
VAANATQTNGRFSAYELELPYLLTAMSYSLHADMGQQAAAGDVPSLSMANPLGMAQKQGGLPVSEVLVETG